MKLYILRAHMAVVFGFTAFIDDEVATGTQYPETEVRKLPEHIPAHGIRC